MHKVVIDWGSSRCRAYLLEGGEVVAKQETNKGMKGVTQAAFATEFESLIAPWRDGLETVYLYGMVTSQQGWVETPYVPCPASLADVSKASVTVQHGGLRLVFLPGLCQTGSAADVMRGEEMQIFGIAPQPDAQTIILPGTHSKWAQVEGGVVTSFRTIMTGEVFDLILKRSLAGRLSASDAFHEIVFRKAVSKGFHGGNAISDLFFARAGALLGMLKPEEIHSYLSGLLIGNELREGFGVSPVPSMPIKVVGDTQLGAYYSIALDEIGGACEPVESIVSVNGISLLCDA